MNYIFILKYLILNVKRWNSFKCHANGAERRQATEKLEKRECHSSEWHSLFARVFNLTRSNTL